MGDNLSASIGGSRFATADQKQVAVTLKATSEREGAFASAGRLKRDAALSERVLLAPRLATLIEKIRWLRTSLLTQFRRLEPLQCAKHGSVTLHPFHLGLGEEPLGTRSLTLWRRFSRPLGRRTLPWQAGGREKEMASKLKPIGLKLKKKPIAATASDTLFAKFVERFKRAKYSAGLLMSFIDILEDAKVPGGRYDTLEELGADYPRKLLDNKGEPLRQLVITSGGKEFGIRRAYDKIVHYFVFDQHRVGYPSSAPDATGNWTGSRDWFDALLALSRKERSELRSRVVDHVLATIPEKTIRPEERRTEPALFEETLRSFPLSPPPEAPKERTGAALQGLVFGFLRADNPHLQVRVDRVRAGGERIGKIGDVDGWDGVRLAISAEVKQYRFQGKHVPAVSRFVSAVAERGTVGIIAAIDFDQTAYDDLYASGLIPLSVDEMLKIVKMWDLAKQRIAVAAFSYYLDAVENSAPLYERFRAFIDAVSEDFAEKNRAAEKQ